MKVILKLDLADDKAKQKAMKKVSGLSGLESIAVDNKRLTVTGNIDLIDLVAKLRKICNTEIISVGPAKEPEKKKEEAKKPDDKKKDGPKEEAAAQNPYQHHHNHYQKQTMAAVPPPSYPPYYQRSVEEDPNGCVIC